jgi:acyl carrier protein
MLVMESFYSELAAIMEVDEVRPDSVLGEFIEWDSLTVLSVIAMVHKEYGLRLHAANLKGLDTAQDLFRFIEEQRGK